MPVTKKVEPFHRDIWFKEEEFKERQARALALLKRENLDGFLITKQETLYYLTGYDTSGYVFFQAMYLHNDGSMKLITRIPDLRQALHTSIIKKEDVVIRPDNAALSPVALVPQVLESYGINSTSKRIGYEPDSATMNLRVGRQLEEAVSGLCTLVDHSYLFGVEMRIIKSESEMRKIRKAAYLVDFAFIRGLKVAKEGAYEGDVWREVVGTIYEGGGDDPSMENIIVSGSKAVLTRYSAGKSTIKRQITFEHAGIYKHYHACLMRTISLGGVSSLARELHRICVQQMKAAMEACRPGRPMGDVFDAYAKIADAKGQRYKEMRLNSCGYSLGATFAPNWMDYPMFVQNQSVIIKPGMVFFIHIIMLDKETDTAASVGQTVEVRENDTVALSKLPFLQTRKATLKAWKNIKKEEYGFTAEEEDEGENLRDIELSDGEDDDFDIEYDFSDYKAAY